MRKNRRKAAKNTFWRDGVLWGRVKIKGRDRKWSLRTDDPDVASQRVAAERERIVAALHYGDARQTFEEAMIGWADRYLPEREVGGEARKRYLVSLGQMEANLQGVYVDEIDRRLVNQIVECRQRAGVSNATIRRDLGALASVLAYAAREELREGNPALERLREIKEKRDPIVLPDPEHVRRVIARAPGLFAKLIEAAWVTGCRQDELVAAPARGALDHQRRELTVIGKGNKLRVIELDPFGGYDVLASLPAHIKAKTLFWHDEGEPYRNVSSRFAEIVRAMAAAATRDGADFRKFRFHDLRHLHAVEWLRNGGSIYDLQQRLGHESITTTELYLKYLTPEQVRTARKPGERNGEQWSRQGSGKGGLSA